MKEFIGFYKGKKASVEAKDLWDAKKKLVSLMKIPTTKIGLLAVMSAEAYDHEDFKFN